VDFPSERVEGENWLIVGESTGLVNPVTGEGIDLAMESGLLAAETIHDKQRNYQQQLETHYASLFNGLRWCQRILMNRALMDYALWQTRQHRFVRDRIVNAVQGFEHPQRMLHPWFILQFLIPLSPAWVFNQVRGLFKDGQH
jgi:flavin-dependent dehydrogenase